VSEAAPRAHLLLITERTWRNNGIQLGRLSDANRMVDALQVCTTHVGLLNGYTEARDWASGTPENLDRDQRDAIRVALNSIRRHLTATDGQDVTIVRTMEFAPFDSSLTIRIKADGMKIW